jgi:hypothetical protein
MIRTMSCTMTGTTARFLRGRVFRTPLVLDYTAGNAIAGVPGGIGFVVIRLFVNHEGGAPIVENGIRPGLYRKIRHDNIHLAFAVGTDVKVQQIAHVKTLRIVEAVLVHGGVEMAAGALKRRAFTLANIVNVNGVRARRQIHEVHFDADAVRRGCDLGGADLLPLCVGDIRMSGLSALLTE